MSDVDYLIQIVAKLRDEASPKLAALKAEIDRLKGTQEAENAERDLGNAIKDTGDEADRSKKKHEGLRTEHEKSRRAADDAGRGAKDLGRNVEEQARSHDKSAESVSGHTKTQQDFAAALAKVRQESRDTGEGVEDLHLRMSKLRTSWANFDNQLRNGELTKGQAKRGIREYASEFENISKKLEQGTAEWRAWGNEADKIANKLKSSDFGASGGFISSLKRGDLENVLQNIGAKFDDLGLRVTGVASYLRGFFDLAKIGFSQQLITGIVSLAGGLFSVASAATQAGAALAGAFISGMGQAIPMLSIIAASIERFKTILQAVSVAGQAEQQHYYDPTEKQVLQLQQASQLISSNQQLSNSYIQLFEAQQRVRDSQIALTEARYTAQRQITELALAEKNAQLQAEGANISLAESKRQLQIAIQRGDVAGLQQAELAVKEAELNKKKADFEIPKTEREARLARQRGVSGAPSVISAVEGLEGSRLAVVQAQQGAEAAQRQKQITELQRQARSSKETQYEAQLKFYEKGMSPTELGLTNALIGIEKELKSPNSPLKRITDYFVEPFANAVERIRSLLKSSSFLGPIDELAKTMGVGLSRLEKATYGSRGTSFFETMAKDASKNIPIVVEALEHLMHLFEDIAKAADPAFHKLSEDWNNFWGKLDNKYEGKGLTRLEEFFNRSVKFAEGFAKLGVALFDLFKTLGSDAAPQGLLTVTNFTQAIKDATNWVDSHKSSVVNFFAEARKGLSLIGELLFGIGKSLVEVFSLSSLQAFNQFIQQIILPALRDVVKLLGFLTKLLLEVANAIPGGKAVLEGLAGVFLSLEIVGKLTGPIFETVKALEAFYAAAKALMIGEGVSKAWLAAKTAFKGAGDAAAIAAPEVAGLGAAGTSSSVASTATRSASVTGGAAAATTAIGGAGAAEAGGGIAGIGAAASVAAVPLAIFAAALVGIGASFLALKDNFLGIRTQFEKFSDWIKSSFIDVWKELKLDFEAVLGRQQSKETIHDLSIAFGELWNILKLIIPLIVKFGGFVILEGILMVLKTLLEPVILSLEGFALALKIIREPLSALTSGIEILGKVWNSVWGGMKSVFNSIVSFISERLANVVTAIKAIVEIANVNLPVVGHIFGSSLTNVENSLTKAENTLNNFAKGVTSHRQTVETEVPKMGVTYENVFGKIGDTVTKTARITKEGISSIANQTLNALRVLNPGGIQPLSKGGPPLAPGIEKLVQGHATGAYIPATPGGRIARVGEGGHDEVVLSTDPKHADRSRSLLGQYFSRAPHMATGGRIKDYPGPEGRVDQGVDFAGPGPVKAVLPGEVRSTGLWPGWPGTGGLVYQTVKGLIYIMEDFLPAVRAKAKIIAGQILGTDTGGSSGIETGWANASGTGPLVPYTPAQAAIDRAGGTAPTSGGESFARFLGGGTGSGVSGAISAVKTFKELVAPKIKGGGAIGKIGQGALDITAKAANIYLEKHGGSATSAGSSTQQAGSVRGIGGWVRTGATIDPTQGQAPTYSAHGGFSFAELLEAGSNAGMRPDLTQLLGEPRGSYGMPMETSIKIRMPGSNRAYTIWKNDVGSGQAGNPHYTIDLHQSIANALGWHPNEDVEVAKMAIGGTIRRLATRHLRKKILQFAQGGIAPWGGRPVPIIAHEGERIMNPAQYRETARLAGTSPGGLDRHLGYDGSPRQSFAAGGPVFLSEHSQPRSLSNEFESSLSSEFSIGTIGNIVKVFKKIKEGFKKLKDISKKNYEKELIKYINEITIETSGILARIQEGREYFKASIEKRAVGKEYTNKGGKIQLGPKGQIGISEFTEKNLAEESRYLQNEKNIIEQTIRETKKLKKSSSRSAALKALTLKQKELGETIDQNIEARYQAETQTIQSRNTESNNQYQVISQEQQTKISKAQGLGNLSEIGKLEEQSASSAKIQIAKLIPILQQAEKIGNKELESSIKQEIISLQQTINSAIVEKISNAQTLLQRESQAAETKSGERLGISKVLAAEGKYEAAGREEKAGLTEKQANLLATRAQEEQLKEQALREGDTAAAITLGEELNKNNVELAENNLALKANANITRELIISQIEATGQFKSGIYSAAQQGLETLGKITGSTNVAGLVAAAKGREGAYAEERSGLEREAGGIGLGVEGMSPAEILTYLASPAGQSKLKELESGEDKEEKETMYKLVGALESNAENTLKNSEELAKLNGQLNQPQSFSTSAFNSFRTSFFSGMGGLLAPYSAALPPGSRPEGLPVYGSGQVGAPVNTTHIENLNIPHPVEVADPQLFAEEMSHAISTTPPTS